MELVLIAFQWRLMPSNKLRKRYTGCMKNCVRQFPFVLAILVAGWFSSGVYALPREPKTENGEVMTYLTVVAQKCERHYFPPADPQTTSTAAGEVTFDICSDGSVRNVRIVQGPVYTPTGSPDSLGYAALKEAILKSAPFPKAPKELSCPVSVAVVFDKRANATAKLQRLTSNVLGGR